METGYMIADTNYWAKLEYYNNARLMGRPRTRWEDYIDDIGWNRLGLQPSDMLEVVADRDLWWPNLELLPGNPHGHEPALKEEDRNGRTVWFHYP